MTEGVRAMAMLERPEPESPGPREVIVAPEATGLCGSDFHLFAGELSDEAGGSEFPRIQGHEVAATIVAVGAGCREELRPGRRVALYPLHACGECYPCRVGRPNTCENFKLIGVHLDGGLQERLAIGQDQVFPITAEDPAVASLAEPVSIAVRAVNRGRIAAGEKVAVLGAGPIGQAVALVARERGAEALVVDLQESRLALAREIGAETLQWSGHDEVVAHARRWAGAGGPPVAVDATGLAAPVAAMLEMVASAGRAVQVGMSNQEVPLRVGLLTEKEIDILGVSCCGPDEFGEAVGVVERNGALLARMVSHQFALGEAPDALRYAMENPSEVMKVVIRGE
ncbi:MAG: alcohol dehydrogenase catalytic domain-containing protein [Solirubrobacterales bacterium]|nr:alcohol dehydrogenase catalytic domain-containing protein [Solirubrobacterales bacterium]